MYFSTYYSSPADTVNVHFVGPLCESGETNYCEALYKEYKHIVG